MANTSAVSKDKLRSIFDTDSLPDTSFKVKITPITEDEAKDIEFKSLKGIAGKWLDLDEVRKERLGLRGFYWTRILCWITLAQIGVKTMIETGAYTTNMNQTELLNFSSLSYFTSTLKTKLWVATALSDMVQLLYP